MSDLVRAAYDENAELYASLFLNELDGDEQTRKWLGVFAKLAEHRVGELADLGCGPGSVVNYFAELGLSLIGYDLSAGQISQARLAFPSLDFRIGDLAALDYADSELGGIVSRHSIIHVPPSELGGVFEEWMRALEPGGPVFLSFFGSKSSRAHGMPFDHKVATAYELFPTTVAEALRDTGFVNVEVESNPIRPGGRPFDHVTIVAVKPDS